MSDGLSPGAHLRHRRRPEWGIGVVTALERGDGHDNIVVDFEHAGEKKLRLAEGAFEPVPPDEVEAWQRARDAQKAAEKKILRRLAAAVRGKATTLSPVATVECGWNTIAAAGGGAIVASLDGALRVYDAAGVVLDDLPTGLPLSNELTVQGDLIVGRRTHDWGDLLLYHRARRSVQLWRSPIEVGITRVAPAGEGEVLLWCRDTLQLVDASGASRRVPFELAKGSHICSARAWGDALLVGTAGPESDGRPYFHFACIDRAGALRWRREGLDPCPLSASLLVAVARGVVAVDAAGALVSHAPGPPPSDGSVNRNDRTPFVAVGDDVVFCAGRSVTRLRPRDGAVSWTTDLVAFSSLEPPTLAGGVVAATTGVHGEGKMVWLLDAASGAVLEAGEAPTNVEALCAAGPSALAACSYSKRLVAWRGLPGSPERLVLPHPDKVFDLCSPEPGALVAGTKDHLTFWRLLAGPGRPTVSNLDRRRTPGRRTGWARRDHSGGLRCKVFPRFEAPMPLSRLLPLAVALVLLPTGSAGCKRPTDPGQGGPTATTPASADATRVAGAPGPPGPASAADARSPAGAPSPPGPEVAGDEVRAPEGYVAMAVLRVLPTPHGNAVILGHEAEQKLVIIFVGGTEALSIELRRDSQRYPRPLTHDLLDALVGRLGGEIVKVHVDDLRSNAFVGRVYVRQNGRVIDVDARPSDAIALALGNRAPIYVSRKVIDTAGLPKDDLKGGDDVPPEIINRPRPGTMSL